MISSVLIYFFTFSISLVFASYYNRVHLRISRYCLFVLIVICPIIISAYRVGIGTDYYGYRESFFSIKQSISFSTLFSYYQEPLWVVINLLSKSYFQVLLISSILYSCTITIAIIRNKEKTGIVLPLFISYMVFYSLSFNGIRQAIAVSFILLALTYKDTSKKTFILFVVFAGLFHKSAFICLLLLLLKEKGNEKFKKTIILILLSSLLCAFFSNYFKVILDSLHLYSSYLKGETSGGLGFFLYIIPVFFFILYLTYCEHVSDSYFLFLTKLFLLQIPFQILGNSISFADRIAEYGLITQVFLIPYGLSLINKKKNRELFRRFFVAWYLFYYIFMFIVLKSNGVFPYRF